MKVKLIIKNCIPGYIIRIEKLSDKSLISQGVATGKVYTDEYEYSSDIPVFVKCRYKSYLPFEHISTITSKGLFVRVLRIREEEI